MMSTCATVADPVVAATSPTTAMVLFALTFATLGGLVPMEAYGRDWRRRLRRGECGRAGEARAQRASRENTSRLWELPLARTVGQGRILQQQGPQQVRHALPVRQTPTRLRAAQL